MHGHVENKFMDLEKKMKSSEEVWYKNILDSEQRTDALLTKAINDSVKKAHQHCIGANNAGSTFCGLFLLPVDPEELPNASTETAKVLQPKGVRFRAICSNIGDNRCVKVQTREVKSVFTEDTVVCAENDQPIFQKQKKIEAVNRHVWDIK